MSEADLRALFVHDIPAEFEIAEAVAQLDAAVLGRSVPVAAVQKSMWWAASPVPI